MVLGPNSPKMQLSANWYFVLRTSRADRRADHRDATMSQVLPLGARNRRGPCTSVTLTTAIHTCAELIDKCIGSKMWVLMKGDKELVGTLKGARCTVAHCLAGTRHVLTDAAQPSSTSPHLQALTTTSTWCLRTSPSSAPIPTSRREPPLAPTAPHGTPPAHARARDHRTLARRRSEITSEGKRITKLDSILLNGNNVALVRPPAPPSASPTPRLPPHEPPC